MLVIMYLPSAHVAEGSHVSRMGTGTVRPPDDGIGPVSIVGPTVGFGAPSTTTRMATVESKGIPTSSRSFVPAVAVRVGELTQTCLPPSSDSKLYSTWADDAEPCSQLT